jgi:phosphopantetheine adenylyltransferase
MNYSKNLLTAAQTAQMYSEQITGNLTKLRQLQEMARQGQAISKGDMGTLAYVVSGPKMAQQVRDMQNMQRALTDLNGNLGDLQARYNYTMQMAQKYGMTIEQYQKNQAAQSAKRVQSAELEQKANVKSIQHVQESYAQVQRFQDAMPETNTALMQQMNSQMSLLNTTNAKMLEYLISSNAAKNDGIGTAQAEEDAKTQRLNDYYSGAKATNARVRDSTYKSIGQPKKSAE